jgi:uncharacterized protein
MPVKPSEKEEEYFRREELLRKKKLEEERLKIFADEERDRLKKLHHMRCPKCGMELAEIDYKGIKVDTCLACSGVWLDAGELEALLKLEKKVIDKLFGIFKK